jgi:hypothetical protein
MYAFLFSASSGMEVKEIKVDRSIQDMTMEVSGRDLFISLKSETV